MIVAERKPLGEIKSFLEDYNKVLVLGCGTCATVCLAGGESEVKVVAAGLRIGFLKEDKEIEILEECITRQCEPEFVDPIIERAKNDSVEAILSLGCGVGVNFLAQKLETVPVYPGVNTKFFGAAIEPGVWIEMCAGCGNCILHLTGGICPVARCSKSILNGPCGGSSNGKCEINPDVDCGWQLIVERMKNIGTIERLYEIIPPRDWSTSHSGGPRRVVHEEVLSLNQEEKQNDGKADSEKRE
ncbi:MAG: methylenetetrahydrofolate reductase C-terminal domain-containing protein [Spirochaetota bacterium]|nr:MAG: methylenetetrahydrofolate reductase C-terminal domain-containing protein [Spirochaetota bacterium]